MIHVLFALLLAAAPVAPRAKTWTVPGTGVTFHLSPHDLVATRAGKPLWSLERHRAAFQAKYAADGTNPDGNEEEADLTLSVRCAVGTLVCLHWEFYGDFGGAHPEDMQGDVVEDVRNPTAVQKALDGKSSVGLLKLFHEADVVAALKRDPFIKKHVADAKAFARARTVAALFAALDARGDCVQFLPSDVANDFAFHHLEGDRVAVRIGLGYGPEVCRGQETVLGVLLPIPPSLARALRHASDRSKGFLGADAKGAPHRAFHWQSNGKESP